MKNRIAIIAAYAGTLLCGGLLTLTATTGAFASEKLKTNTTNAPTLSGSINVNEGTDYRKKGTTTGRRYQSPSAKTNKGRCDKDPLKLNC